jgi:hypothetical protein
VVAVTGCGTRHDRPAAVGGEAGVLAGALGASRALIGAYAPVAAALHGSRARLVGELDARERAGAGALAAALRAVGRAPVPAPAGALAADLARARRAAAAGDGQGALHALADAQLAAGWVRLGALPLLTDPAHRRLVANLAAGGAGQQTALLAALGREPLPVAFAGLTPA